jgi:bifunctional DNA-binding transcriptional regulator/antitoxin component of YhaV-PrlF toxin-antitoxin module
MAKAKTTTKAGRKGRRVVPAARRRSARSKPLTVGEVVAAAFEVVEGDVEKARELLSSREMARALGRRIVID